MDQEDVALQLNRVREILTNYPYQITGQWFNSVDVQLDGYAFIRCRFDHCTIYLRRGDFVLDHCFFNMCTVYFYDDAVTVVRFYNVFSIPPASFPEHVRPIQHEDGTVSVSKIVQ
jgi:hypothetical protein